MNYLEEMKVVKNGFACNYLCHIEVVFKAGNVYPAHFHNYIEILYGISGTYEVILNGKCHEFTKGDLVLINSMENFGYELAIQNHIGFTTFI